MIYVRKSFSSHSIYFEKKYIYIYIYIFKNIKYNKWNDPVPRMYCFIRKRKRFLKQYYAFFKRHAKVGGSRPICFLKRLKRASICCNCVWRSNSKRYRNVIMQVKNVLTRQLILLIPSSRLSFKTTRCHDYDLCAISIHKKGIKVVFTFQKHKS